MQEIPSTGRSSILSHVVYIAIEQIPQEKEGKGQKGKEINLLIRE